MLNRVLVVTMIGALVTASCSSGGSDDDALGDVSSSEVVEVDDTAPVGTPDDSTVDDSTVDAGTVDGGNDDVLTPDTTEDSVAGPGTDVAADVDPEAEAATADADLLTLSDMPLGWTEIPVDGEETLDDELAAARREYVACVGSEGITIFDFARTVAATGDYIGPNGESVVHTIAIDTEDAVEDFMASFSAEGVETCLADNIGPVLAAGTARPDPDGVVPDDLAVGEATAERLEVGTAGDETAAYRMTIAVTVDGVDVDLIVDLVATRVGDTVSGITAQSSVTPFDSDQLDSLVQAVANRLA